MHLRQAVVSRKDRTSSPTLFGGKEGVITIQQKLCFACCLHEEPPVLMGQGASTVQEALEEDVMRVNSVQ